MKGLYHDWILILQGLYRILRPCALQDQIAIEMTGANLVLILENRDSRQTGRAAHTLHEVIL